MAKQSVARPHNLIWGAAHCMHIANVIFFVYFPPGLAVGCVSCADVAAVYMYVYVCMYAYNIGVELVW